MALFITRVELHDATWQDYDSLHQAMKARNFNRAVQATDGTWYALPTAEYYATGDVTAEYVRDAAQAAAVSTGKRHSIVVSEASKILWLGLARA